MQLIRDYKPDKTRQQFFRNALMITVAGNLLLVLGKGAVAYLSDSRALYADAANSASDVVYSFMLVLGLWIAQQPPDLSHPQGHARFEPLVGLAVAAAMTFAGYEAGRASVVRLLAGGLAVEPGWPTLALLGSALLKGAMFLSVRAIARRVSSPTLGTVAQDNLSDVLTSIAAFVGVIGSNLLHPLADPVAGALVSVWIFRAAFGAWKENLHYLTGGGAPPELPGKIRTVAQAVPGVLDVHQVLTEYVGARLILDLHINVDKTLSITEAHAIADAVQEALEALPEVDRAYVHVEPLL
ncbi:MAG TPA: cation diffusion facilitator family transporter [Anaerolineae bacterium]|nr:cation diffusion facilitator family transporter [Anaerolineae bacterium]